MKIPLQRIIFFNGCPPPIPGQGNVVTDTHAEMWFDTDLRLVFITPNTNARGGSQLPTHTLGTEGIDMQVKFAEEFPGWRKEREAKQQKKAS